MARNSVSVKLTERGKRTASVLKEYNRRHSAENDGEVVAAPWYYQYMDSYNEELCDIASELMVEEA